MGIIEEDVQNILPSIELEVLRGKTCFVTGGTGLIGQTLVPTLKAAGSRPLLLVRSESKARELYGDSCDYIQGTIEQLPPVDRQVDYVIHLASPTASRFFVDYPVETITIAIEGTRNLLELARNKKVSGFVYLSSMEVYGHPLKGHPVKEKDIAGFDTRIPRNSYPVSKSLCEALCTAYAVEYEAPAMTLRLTQTFGPGVDYGDGRIFAEFMRCVIEQKNIVLHTEGLTERCYLYTADAVAAILTALVKGKAGEVYNAANPATYCSIRQMAELAAGLGNISVETQIDGIQRGYADTLYMDLDVSQLEALGWMPRTGLKDMFERMIMDQISRNEQK